MAKKIEWADAARADVRRIGRETAMRILESLMFDRRKRSCYTLGEAVW